MPPRSEYTRLVSLGDVLGVCRRLADEGDEVYRRADPRRRSAQNSSAIRTFRQRRRCPEKPSQPCWTISDRLLRTWTQIICAGPLLQVFIFLKLGADVATANWGLKFDGTRHIADRFLFRRPCCQPSIALQPLAE